jgi:dephospho-CoA kinase
MLKVGITGGIGSGKTTVCRLFSLLGIPVFNADDESKKILDADNDVVTEVKNLLGNVYENGIADRKKIASIVFADKNKLEKLNAIMHPAVIRAFEKWAAQQKNVPYVLKEAALIFEASTHIGLDKIIVVTAPEEQRLKRIISRDKTTEHAVRSRMQHQLSEEEKISRADFVIINDSKHSLIEQVLEIDRALKNETV